MAIPTAFRPTGYTTCPSDRNSITRSFQVPTKLSRPMSLPPSLPRDPSPPGASRGIGDPGSAPPAGDGRAVRVVLASILETRALAARDGGPDEYSPPAPDPRRGPGPSSRAPCGRRRAPREKAGQDRGAVQGRHREARRRLQVRADPSEREVDLLRRLCLGGRQRPDRDRPRGRGVL